MSKTTYEAYLDRYGELTYRTVGTSMLPMLKQDRDLFTVRKRNGERCRKYDVVLYRRPPSHYVLHRIVEVREMDYVILGDNCVNREFGITDDDIIGVLTSFVHRGKTYSVEDIRYRLYSRLWYAAYPLRAGVKRLIGKLK